MAELIWLVPLLPLLGVVINTLLGLNDLRRSRANAHHDHGHDHGHGHADAHHGHGDNPTSKRSGLIASLMVGLGFVLTLVTLVELLGMPAPTTLGENNRWFDVTYWNWMAFGDLKIPFGFLIDQLSVTMMLLVTGVGTLIHLYAIGYMSHDERPTRFFVYLNLFIVAMLMLVMGNNFVMLFLGWEGVGLCSFLLIGFWFEQRDPPWASVKAFVTNRVGDFGLLMAMFAIYALARKPDGTFLHSLIFREVLDQGTVFSLQQYSTFFMGTQYTAAGAIAFMLLLGVTGKSAQIPLFVWLPDAMAGPTPVSALIHAATMVTAGVYLMIRTHPIFELAPSVQSTVTFIGVATALVAASIALGQYDIKKVLAFSTVSQLGFMVAAVGMGAYVAAMFHLLTHGIFKALLFLGSGSVIHGFGNEQDMRKMGGLRKKMPTTFWTYIVGTMGLIGFPLISGFWSKDEIIGHAFDHDHRTVGILLIVGAVLTSFYMGRQISMVFFGEQRDQHIHAHESSRWMTAPLIGLALLTLASGLINVPGWHPLTTWLEPIVEEEAAKFHLNIAAIVTILGLLAFAAGFYLYNWAAKHKRIKPNQRDLLHHWGGDFYAILEEKWGFDALYNAVLVKPYKALASFFGKFFDVKIIDGIVNGTAELVGLSGRGLRTFQSGYVRSYALMFVIGVVIVLGFFALR